MQYCKSCSAITKHLRSLIVSWCVMLMSCLCFSMVMDWIVSLVSMSWLKPVKVTDKWVSRARNGKLAVIMAHKAPTTSNSPYSDRQTHIPWTQQLSTCKLSRHVWWCDMLPVKGSGSVFHIADRWPPFNVCHQAEFLFAGVESCGDKNGLLALRFGYWPGTTRQSCASLRYDIHLRCQYALVICSSWLKTSDCYPKKFCSFLYLTNNQLLLIRTAI